MGMKLKNGEASSTYEQILERMEELKQAYRSAILFSWGGVGWGSPLSALFCSVLHGWASTVCSLCIWAFAACWVLSSPHIWLYCHTSCLAAPFEQNTFKEPASLALALKSIFCPDATSAWFFPHRFHMQAVRRLAPPKKKAKTPSPAQSATEEDDDTDSVCVAASGTPLPA